MPTRDDGPPRDPLVQALEFPLGRLLSTPGAIESVPPDDMSRALRRHARGDRGELGPEDVRTNDEALQHGGRLPSSYVSEAGVKFWITTEADRSATTVLLPNEY